MVQLLVAQLSLLFLLCNSCFCFASPLKQFDDEEDRGLPDFDLQPQVPLELDENGQCIYVKSEEGTYVFASPGSQEICGLYVIAEPDKRVEFEFLSFDVSCAKGGLISVIDGWELNGQFFPSSVDRPSGRQNFAEFCGKRKPRRAILSSQNVALIEYRVPTKGQGFTVTVRFVDNPKPCNVVLQQPEGTYTLRNYNRRINCSVSVIFPLSVRILAASLGVQSSWPSQQQQQHGLEMETGLLTKCKKRDLRDYIEIRGGDGLDPALMDTVVDYCGLVSVPAGRRPVTVACGNTALRMVSSGHFENSVTFSFELPSDLSHIDLVCPSFFGGGGAPSL